VKRIAWTLAGVGAFIGLVVVTTPAQEPVPEWSFVAEVTDTGWAMTCSQGCAWTELTFSCGEATRCRVRINQSGVGPAERQD